MLEDGPAPTLEKAAWRRDLRLRILAVAMIPLLIAVSLLAGYFTQRQIEAGWTALSDQGQAMTRRLAEATAFDLVAGNYPYAKRLLDYELSNGDCLSIGIADQTGKWWLVNGRATLLPASAAVGAERAWKSGERIYYTQPIRLGGSAEQDPYLAAGVARPGSVIGQVTVVLNAESVTAARRHILLVSLSLALSMLVFTGWLAWRLSQRLSQPLHAVIAAVRGIAQGSLGRRVAAVSPGELGELERGINHMASILERHAGELERRIDEATAELRAQKQTAEAAVLARSRFLAAASHDLRQPMHALTLLLSALKEKLPRATGEASEVLRLVENIEASAHAMASLLNALLDLSRLDAGVVVARPLCFPVSAVLLRLANQYGPLAQEKGLRLKIHDSRLAAYNDPVLLERILGNLIANAIRYTEHGRIVVGLRRVQQEWLRFEVWDSGRGIPEAYRERIFEEYFQLENPERGRDKGLGLGLAIVRRLGQLIGSPVEVRSTVGKGSCFSLRVMRCEPASATVASEPFAAVAPTAGTATAPMVAFIDDDETILEAMTAVFAQWGIDLAVGTCASQVRDDLMELGRRPDAILSDYRLPEGHTGIDAIAALRGVFGRNIPAALITGDTAAATIQAITASGLPVLHKPLKPAVLRAFVNHMLSG